MGNIDIVNPVWILNSKPTTIHQGEKIVITTKPTEKQIKNISTNIPTITTIPTKNYIENGKEKDMQQIYLSE